MKLDLELPLVEEAVWLALRDDTDFHARREALYEIGDAEDRERAFAELARARFERLGLRERLEGWLAERARIAASVGLCTVSRATRRRDEGAELYVQARPGGSPGPADRRLHIRLRPETLVDAQAAQSLLRGELLHVADMLDPAFGYEPTLGASDAGPTYDRLLLERYGASWSTSVTGRLVQSGKLAPGARGPARSRFARAFPALAGSEAVFERLFTGPRPTHAELVELAREPEAAGARSATWRCPLCGLPVQDGREAVGRALASRIRDDFPGFEPDAAVCLRCRELYEPGAPAELG